MLLYYRKCLWLRVEDGKLAAVEAGNGENCAITLPPQAFAPLVLGHKTWRKLRSSHPDVSIKPLWRPLGDVLFPGLDGLIYTSY